MLTEAITSCKNCCFATYDNITQTGCELERLSAFVLNGTTPIEAYDEEKEFYLIPNRQCMFKRNQQWRKNHAEEEGHLYEAALDETPFPYHVIITGHNNVVHILNSIQAVVNQGILPAKISVIRPYGTTSDIKTIRLFLENIQRTCGVPWRLENILNPEIVLPIHQQYLVLTTNKIPFLIFMEAGATITPNTIETIKHKIYVDLLQFSAIVHSLSPEITIMPFNVWTYFRLTTNPNLPIIENIQKVNEEEGNDSCAHIYRLLDLVPTSQHPRLLSYTPAQSH